MPLLAPTMVRRGRAWSLKRSWLTVIEPSESTMKVKTDHSSSAWRNRFTVSMNLWDGRLAIANSDIKGRGKFTWFIFRPSRSFLAQRMPYPGKSVRDRCGPICGPYGGRPGFWSTCPPPWIARASPTPRLRRLVEWRRGQTALAPPSKPDLPLAADSARDLCRPLRRSIVDCGLFRF
jgi:hypothetical protein